MDLDRLNISYLRLNDGNAGRDLEEEFSVFVEFRLVEMLMHPNNPAELGAFELKIRHRGVELTDSLELCNQHLVLNL